jgi:adenylate kinase family enzyme
MRAGDRPDDADPVKIQKRLDWYNEKVLPVLEYFKQNNTMTMCDIDGEPDVAQVQNQVLEFLDKI